MEPNVLVLMGDDPEKMLDDFKDIPRVIIVYPRGRGPTAKVLIRKDVDIIQSDYSTIPDFSDLDLIRDALLYLINASYLGAKDRVLVAFSKNGEHHRLYFDLSSMALPSLMESLSDFLDKEVVEGIMRIAMSVVRRGREGNPAGALFIVGDVDNVMKHAVQKIANPMPSIPLEERNVRNEENHESIREFAMMDGATLVDEDGFVRATGIYIKTLSIDDWIVDGGGRHLAAQAITNITKAVSFVVSSEGTIRVYRNGKMIFELKDF